MDLCGPVRCWLRKYRWKFPSPRKSYIIRHEILRHQTLLLWTTTQLENPKIYWNVTIRSDLRRKFMYRKSLCIDPRGRTREVIHSTYPANGASSSLKWVCWRSCSEKNSLPLSLSLLPLPSLRKANCIFFFFFEYMMMIDCSTFSLSFQYRPLRKYITCKLLSFFLRFAQKPGLRYMSPMSFAQIWSDC